MNIRSYLGTGAWHEPRENRSPAELHSGTNDCKRQTEVRRGEEHLDRLQGRHFLQIPGPSPVPDRVLRAISMPIIDHRGPQFKALGQEVLEGCRSVFKTAGPVVIFPSSGT